MPLADNEWGDWDPSQYDVPPRPTWLENPLCKDEHELPSSLITTTNKRRNTSSTPKEFYSPSLRDFRCWYVCARETGRHQKYLQHIEELAVAFKHATPGAEIDVHRININIHLSEADIRNRRNDQRSYQELLEKFCETLKL